jgi:hypothetical protein
VPEHPLVERYVRVALFRLQAQRSLASFLVRELDRILRRGSGVREDVGLDTARPQAHPDLDVRCHVDALRVRLRALEDELLLFELRPADDPDPLRAVDVGRLLPERVEPRREPRFVWRLLEDREERPPEEPTPAASPDPAACGTPCAACSPA